ncbi:MAG: helix-turn-helix transcriptional regulator [Oscillospiraceae bacterium]|nr:helix-turn-helix transcriptional regulator [Oscillospiraceae bacterium]MBQ7130044.1 helix-turn-helix transcriptional regulator [Oscillospiraceae bacterium]
MDEQIGKRLREMRQNAKLSQARVAAVVGSRQSAVARFESGEAHVPSTVMVRYADYFDVSLDYIFGRTDNPQGKLYENKPKIEKAYPEMEKFIEMCFDPGSPMNERLKESLLRLMKEGAE